MQAHPRLAALPLSCALAVVASAPLAGQTVVLDEDFRSCVVPPAGWSEDNNGVGPGWQDDICEFAFHDDDFGQNVNRLLSPSLDLTGVSPVWLHFVEELTFAQYLDVNAVEVSTDGGQSWTGVWLGTERNDGSYARHVDLSGYAGMSDVTISFLYEGDLGNEWRIDDVLVDDQPFVPPPRWPNLPTDFVSAIQYYETFDALGGVVPPHMAVNELNAATRDPDPDAWCNLGQRAPALDPYSGQYALEMGLNPSSTLYHQVSNALIIGLDGSNVSNFALEFQAVHYGEELHADDGVFVSRDGVDWQPVVTDWETLLGGSGSAGVWTPVVCDLSSTIVDVSGEFYVAIAQQDDYPFANLDGLAVDDLSLGARPPLLYDVQNLTAGQTATFTVTGADPTSLVIIGYSLSGPGPTSTAFGVADLSQPITQLGRFTPDANGEVVTQSPVPPTGGGAPVWTQALEITSASLGIWSNPLALTVQ